MMMKTHPKAAVLPRKVKQITESSAPKESKDSQIIKAVDRATPLEQPAVGAPPPPQVQPNRRTRPLGIPGLFVLALLVAMYLARSLLVPVMLAVLLSFVLAPVVRWLKRHHIKEGVSALVLVGALVAGAGYAIYALSVPAADWLSHAPENIVKLEQKISVLRKPVERMREATGKVKDITKLDEGEKPEVAVKYESIAGKILATGTEVLEQALVVIVLLYFLLAAGDMFLRKVVRVLPRVEDKIKAVELARQIESDIGHYLFTISIVNVGFGCAVGLAMYLAGMPTPALWGIMAGLLEFIPYVGATISLLVLTGVSFLTFETTGRALLAPGIFLAIDLVVENFLNPLIVGKRLALNPVVVFAALVFWGWMWGIVGALAAVPILVVIKVFCDHIEQYRFIGEFISAEQHE